MPCRATNGRARRNIVGLDSPVRTKSQSVHHDTHQWFEPSRGEQWCIRVHGHMLWPLCIMEKIAAPASNKPPMHFMRKMQIFSHQLKDCDLRIDGDVFNSLRRSLWLFQQAHITRGRNRSNAPIRMRPSFHQVGVEELYPKLVACR